FNPAAGGWRIKDKIRSLAVFKKLNLMDSYAGLGSFDIIFCRNVAIYFTAADKRKLFQKLGQVLARDGYLIIGGSESLSGVAPQFQTRNYLQGVYYQLQGAEEAMEKARKPVPAASASPAAKKTAAKAPPERKKSPPRTPVEPARRPQTSASSVTSPASVPPTTAKKEKPAPAAEVNAASGEIVEAPMGIPEILPDDSVETTAAFLDSAGSSEEAGESLLGNLPAARRTGESMVFGRETANGEEKKTSLLQKIAEQNQDGDDDQE
ncbi:MAG: CheR family methyltransferase, partial [Pseudomonadota bacterium]|nr:CheR family methyltransferase [Pseudomonadota bacterium]